MRSSSDALLSASHACKVLDRHLVVAIGRTLLRDIDARARTNQPLERHLIDRLPPFEEMNRRIDVRAAVLGAHEPVGGVVVALLGNACRLANQLEAIFGRPVDRRCVEGVREIDHAASLPVA